MRDWDPCEHPPGSRICGWCLPTPKRYPRVMGVSEGFDAPEYCHYPAPEPSNGGALCARRPGHREVGLFCTPDRWLAQIRDLHDAEDNPVLAPPREDAPAKPCTRCRVRRASWFGVWCPTCREEAVVLLRAWMKTQ